MAWRNKKIQSTISKQSNRGQFTNATLVRLQIGRVYWPLGARDAFALFIKDLFIQLCPKRPGSAANVSLSYAPSVCVCFLTCMCKQNSFIRRFNCNWHHPNVDIPAQMIANTPGTKQLNLACTLQCYYLNANFL